MAHPPVTIVDANDKAVGAMQLRKVWETGEYHRIVRVMVESSDGRILLQHRSKTVELYPDCWDLSASGHVDGGVNYEAAARQEMAEEIGITSGELEEIMYYESRETYGGRILNRFNKLYRLRMNDTPTHFAPEEVSEVKWVTQQEMRDLVALHPDKVSDGLRQSVERLYDTVPNRSLVAAI